MPRPPSKGRVTSAFGVRPKPTPTSPAFHYGEDTIGDGNYAPVSGRVIQAAYVGAYGNRVIIDAGGGVHWWTCHHASMSVSVGQQVIEGVTRTGPMGATGNVTGVHVHTERRTGASGPGGGTATNPRDFYATTAGGATTTPIGDPDMELKELQDAKGNDGRNLWDSIIQTRSELRDRAREGATDALFNNRVQGRNVFDWFIQATADRAASDAKDAARDAALMTAVQSLAAGSGADPKALAAEVRKAAQEGATASLVAADFPTEESIAAAVLSAQERAELVRLRAEVARLEKA